MHCGPHEKFRRASEIGLVLAVLALVGSGCGNAKRDFREDQLNPRIAQVAEQRAEFAALLSSSRPRRSADRRVLLDQLGRLGAAMRRVASLTPPGEVKAKFRRYTRANAALLAGLSRFVGALANGSPADQDQAEAQAQAALARAGRAQTALQHALE